MATLQCGYYPAAVKLQYLGGPLHSGVPLHTPVFYHIWTDLYSLCINPAFELL